MQSTRYYCHTLIKLELSRQSRWWWWWWWWWWWSRSTLLRMKNVSDKICTVNQNTHFRFYNKLFFFFRKSCRLWENVEKCGTARQATDTNIERRMRYAFWIIKSADTHTHGIYKTYYFSTETTVTRKRLIVTLRAYCLSCYIWSLI